MKLVPYLERCGFAGVVPLASPVAKFTSREAKYASFTGVNVGRVRSVLGKAKLHDPKTGRFIFLLAKDKAIRVDTVNKQIVLANGHVIVARLLQTLERKAK